MLSQIFAEQRAILGMDSSPLRFDWRRGLGEALRTTHRRRREMLNAAGGWLGYQYREWHDLPEKVRRAMDARLIDRA